MIAGVFVQTPAGVTLNALMRVVVVVRDPDATVGAAGDVARRVDPESPTRPVGDVHAQLPLPSKALIRSCPVEATSTTSLAASHVTPIGVLRQVLHVPVPPCVQRHTPAEVKDCTRLLPASAM